jgi:hypothetical protein
MVDARGETAQPSYALCNGIGRGNGWDELRTLALNLAGTPALALATATAS